MADYGDDQVEHIPVPAPGVTDLDPHLAQAAEEEPNFAEQFYPARPRSLRPKARRQGVVSTLQPPVEPLATNPAYVDWLVNQSMLQDAVNVSRQLTGQAEMWANPYADPLPRRAVNMASVWFTAYPISLITSNGESFLAALGSHDLWEVFRHIGIKAVHTGPVKLAGGLDGWSHTPSIDGHFDRISMAIDPLFGNEDEFRSMQQTAENHGGIIIDDIIPGHTGKGADFRLATMNHSDYPGIYHMVSIPKEAWHMLPEVPEGKDSVNLSPHDELRLQEAGYIIGELQRVIFYEPGVKETNWSATREILGSDGQSYRWVYLHYFKDGQPTIDWLDPTFSGMRLVLGDALHSILDLGAGGLRLDANGFLGVERAGDESAAPAWSEGHPLSVTANQIIGSMVRKVGGFTFQELNLTVDAIALTSESGPDLSYDFITRPAYHHAFVTADTEFLRLTLNEGIKYGIDQASLVHALQNHDELTYELVHFTTAHAEDEFTYQGKTVRGAELAEHIRDDLRTRLTGQAGPYNAPFTLNGIACTTASVVAAGLGITDFDDIDDREMERIRSAHLLLAAFNALQPGVFALSGWDLVGALPLTREEVPDVIATGDTRWLSRGAHDLMGWDPHADTSPGGMPRARTLYGSLPRQLTDPSSFAARLKAMLEMREAHGIATGELLSVPETTNPAVLAMINRLESGEIQVSVFNFSEQHTLVTVSSKYLQPTYHVVDLGTNHTFATINPHPVMRYRGAFDLEIAPFGYHALLVKCQAAKHSLGPHS